MQIYVPSATRYFGKFNRAPEEMAHQEPVKAWEILLMYFVLMLTGNPFFVTHYDILVAFSFVIPLYYLFRNTTRVISYQTVLIFVFLLGYELMHAFVYSLDYSKTIFKLALVLLLGFSVVQLLRDKFIRVLVDTMIIISIVSIIFTILCYIPGINWFLYELAIKTFPMPPDAGKDYIPWTLLIYTFHPQYFAGEFSYVRNAGIFWESGAFAVFLNITLYLRYITKRIVHVRDLFDTKSTILIITTLTTTSTMGFLTLMVLLTFFTLKLRTNLKFMFLLLMILTTYVTFVNVDYLGDKISTQLAESRETNNRFGAALMDWEDFKKRPLIGSSRRIEVIFKTQERSQKTRRPNGLTNFLREYGLIYCAIYFILVYRSFSQIFYAHHGYRKSGVAFFGVFLLWLVSFSELLFDLPFFKALIFLAMVYYPITEQDYQNEPVRQTDLQSA